MKQDPEIKVAKIILLSSKGLLVDRLKGYEFGADDYVSKPFSIDELTAKLKVFAKLDFRHGEEKGEDQTDISNYLHILYPIKQTLRSLLYIKSKSPYCYLYKEVKDLNPQKFRISLKILEEHFQSQDLLRVHNQFVVNPSKVSKAVKKTRQYELVLVDALGDTENIPLGRIYQDIIQRKYPDWF